MAKIQIKSEKLTPFGGIFSGHGAKHKAFALTGRVFKILIILISKLSPKHPPN